MEADGRQLTAYRWLVRVGIGIGMITFVGGGLWLVAGAGMYGSPVNGAFEVEPTTGFPNYWYWAFWLLWAVVADPIALLPCALVERFFPRVGAVAMIVAATFVAEAGIRSGGNHWGYVGEDALIVIGCITMPMLLLAVSLLALSARRIRWQAVIAALFVTIILVVGLRVRYTEEKACWDANRPRQPQTDVNLRGKLWLGAYGLAILGFVGSGVIVWYRQKRGMGERRPQSS